MQLHLSTQNKNMALKYMFYIYIYMYPSTATIVHERLSVMDGENYCWSCPSSSSTIT